MTRCLTVRSSRRVGGCPIEWTLVCVDASPTTDLDRRRLAAWSGTAGPKDRSSVVGRYFPVSARVRRARRILETRCLRAEPASTELLTSANPKYAEAKRALLKRAHFCRREYIAHRVEGREPSTRC
jgi:hypothetical protein